MSTCVSISSEGGPLLIADATTLHSWRGVDGPDYHRACELFDMNPVVEGGGISIDRAIGILWEVKGAGTAYFFSVPLGGFTIVRAWLSDLEDESSIYKLANEPITSPSELGELNIESGTMVVMWAAENGACIKTKDIDREGRPSGELAIDDSVYIFKAPNKKYRVLHDDVSRDIGMARRCHITPI